MPTPVTHNGPATTTERVRCMALARRAPTWQRGCPLGHGHNPRARTVAARHQARWLPAVAQAHTRCSLPATAPGVRGEVAGRAGCWRHRFGPAHGLPNAVGDASCLAVTRRQRRAKSAGLDVRTVPYHSGARVRDPGMTQSGPRHGRWMATERAWCGLRYQPESALRGWCRARGGGGGTRLRRLGMVAVARPCRMARWRFLQTGVGPEGAVLTEA